LPDTLNCPGCHHLLERDDGRWTSPENLACNPPETEHRDHIVSTTELAYPSLVSLPAELRIADTAPGTPPPTRDVVVDTAILTIAFRLIGQAANADFMGEMWDLFPDLGISDFIRVTAKAQAVIAAIQPNSEQYSAAYEILSRRAADHGVV